jgi:hypothetical protein
VTKAALVCPRGGYDQRGVEQEEADREREKFRQHIRERFPEYYSGPRAVGFGRGSGEHGRTRAVPG